MSGNTDNNGAASAAPLTQRLLTPIVWTGGAISTLLILAALGLTTYSVFMRYVIGRPPVWIDQLTGFVLVALVMFGVAEAYRRGNHISIDLLTDNLSRPMRRLRWIWSDLCVLAFSLVLVLSTWEAVEFAHSFGSYTSGSIEIASWIPQLPILIGGLLLGLFSVARLIGHILGGPGK
ncbi:TRAP transporter small permease [Chelativorans salis]|uniref:TRAP transporter small permease protein n=1 Tax=Chelativorans salis TaxID=2978478 RepID=A0ABT2LUV3_9HYPH|nr:TRAP transporter small permease [Chelativorans sp. EGI FJ00035]MCT7378307.1 TRAP transporter small permease [Chelativorans sp. EGI FJ00035]